MVRDPMSCTGCSISPVESSPNIASAISQGIRQTMIPLAVFVLVTFGLVVIILFLLSQLLGLYRGWRLMVSQSPALSSSLAMTIPVVVTKDDEVYRSEGVSFESVPMGSQITSRVQELEGRYKEYNQQLRDHAAQSGRDASADTITRSVLDASMDDAP